jgi:hypothetical protein
MYNSATGKLVMNSGGALIFDTLANYQACCCGPDYEALLILCIRERQIAAGVANGNLITDGTYTLAEYCTAGNLFTDSPTGFLWLAYASNGWAFGASSAPSTVASSSSYFGTSGSPVVTVTSFEELYDEVVKFQRGYSGVSGIVEYDQYGGDSGWEADVGDAKTDAAADWGSVTVNGSLPYASASITISGGLYWAVLGMRRARVESGYTLDTRMARRLRLAIKAELTADSDPYFYEFEEHGFNVANGTFTAYGDDSLAAAASNQGTYPRSSSVLSAWPSPPPGPSGAEGARWGTDEGFVLVDWEFDY